MNPEFKEGRRLTDPSEKLVRKEVVFPSDPEERFEKVLTSFNSGVKSVTLFLLPPDGSYITPEELASKFKKAFRGTNMEDVAPITAPGYCHSTLCPIGLVASEYSIDYWGGGKPIGYGLTRVGERYGLLAAALALDFEHRHKIEKFGLYEILGKTGIGSSKYKHPSYSRARIILLLHKTDRFLNRNELVAVGVGVTASLSSTLTHLRKLGIIDYYVAGAESYARITEKGKLLASELLLPLSRLVRDDQETIDWISKEILPKIRRGLPIYAQTASELYYPHSVSFKRRRTEANRARIRQILLNSPQGATVSELLERIGWKHGTMASYLRYLVEHGQLYVSRKAGVAYYCVKPTDIPVPRPKRAPERGPRINPERRIQRREERQNYEMLRRREKDFPSKPNERLDNLLASFNVGPKAVAFLLLPHNGSRIMAGELGWKFKQAIKETWLASTRHDTASEYCHGSFCPAGLVSEEFTTSSQGREIPVSHKLTEGGQKYGLLAAALALDFEHKHKEEGVSLYSVLGQTAAPGTAQHRTPYTRASILRLLHNRREALSRTDIINELGINRQVASDVLAAFRGAGVINYETVAPLQEAMYTRGSLSKTKVEPYKRETPLMWEIVEICGRLTQEGKLVTERSVQERISKETKARRQAGKPFRDAVNRALSRLAAQGFLVKRGSGVSNRRSSVRLTNKGEVIVSEFLVPMEKLARDDEETINRIRQEILPHVIENLPFYAQTAVELYYPYSISLKRQQARGQAAGF